MIDLRRIQGLPPIQEGVTGQKEAQPRGKEDFAQVLENARESQNKLHFSAHALTRMAERGIELTPLELERVQEAVHRAAEKGSRASLVLLDERAFVISVANSTVITAMDGDNLKEQTVTDIDSAVIL